MNEFIYLVGLTVALLTGSYFIKAILLGTVQILKGIFQLFD